VSFTIDSDNNITFYETEDALSAAATETSQAFSSQKELAKATADWPISRLVEVWNGFVGVPPFDKLKEVKKFTDRKTAINRIWSVLQMLGPGTGSDAQQAAQGAPEAATATQEASPKKGAPKAKKGAKGAKKEAAAPREGTSKAKVIEMLGHKGGATLEEIMLSLQV
jgi:hypothetical protein